MLPDDRRQGQRQEPAAGMCTDCVDEDDICMTSVPRWHAPCMWCRDACVRVTAPRCARDQRIPRRAVRELCSPARRHVALCLCGVYIWRESYKALYSNAIRSAKILRLSYGFYGFNVMCVKKIRPTTTVTELTELFSWCIQAVYISTADKSVSYTKENAAASARSAPSAHAPVVPCALGLITRVGLHRGRTQHMSLSAPDVKTRCSRRVEGTHEHRSAHGM